MRFLFQPICRANDRFVTSLFDLFRDPFFSSISYLTFGILFKKKKKDHRNDPWSGYFCLHLYVDGP